MRRDSASSLKCTHWRNKKRLNKLINQQQEQRRPRNLAELQVLEPGPESVQVLALRM